MNRALKRDHFPLPNHIISEYMTCTKWCLFRSQIPQRILALRGDPENLKKMSKSSTDPKSRILITESSDEIRAKIRGAVTDSANAVPSPPLTNTEHGDPLAYLSPGVANLVTILASCTGEQLSDVAWRYRGKSYGVLKNDVAEAVCKNSTLSGRSS
jgi:tryptophanyl-tRNA synthetase